MVSLSFLNTWSISSSAGGSCAQRMRARRNRVDQRRAQLGDLRRASSDFGYGFGYPVTATTSFGLPAMNTRYCCRMVVRFRLRFDHSVVLPRIDAAQLAAGEVVTLDVVEAVVDQLHDRVFSSPTVIVIRSGR